MGKKKALTLVELLVAISVSTILVALLASSIVFIRKTNSTTTDITSSQYYLRKIKDYILENELDDEIELSKFNYQDSNLYYDENIIFADLIYDDLKIKYYENDYAYNCEIDYTVNDKLSYIKFVVKMKE